MRVNQVNISGVYQLDQVENYGKYLLALDIPKFAVRNIETMKYVCNCYNPNSTTTQFNKALGGFDTKTTLNTTTLHPQQKLNTSNISVLTDPILTKPHR